MPLDDTSFARISKLVEQYNAKSKKIRDDDNLSHVGKQRALAALYVQHRDQIGDIREKANQAYTNRKGYLMGEVFGVHGATNPAEVMAMRDAMDRAADIDTPAKARRMFQQAHLTGDEYLRRAIAATAFDRRGDSDLGDHWAGLFNDYAQTQDDRRQGLVAELDQLHQANGKRARLQENILCNLSKPSELNGWGDIDAVAAGAINLGPESEGDAA
ncbi:hypothetical protein [Streptomyces sp. NPDC127108]|uniref:hypothetical protein n=1 Tax=Streptomyces sp. NPDC127108 TaxID=3345361 RepID=UPI00362B8594